MSDRKESGHDKRDVAHYVQELDREKRSAVYYVKECGSYIEGPYSTYDQAADAAAAFNYAYDSEFCLFSVGGPISHDEFNRMLGLDG